MTNKPKSGGISRRKFISTTGCAAMGLTTLFSSLISMKAIAAAALDKTREGSSENYKAMVCLLLSGGADSHNMLIPRSDSAYGSYHTTRGGIAIPQSSILPIQHPGMGGEQYGVHPAMGEVKSLFDAGKLSFLANVGSLVEPVTKNEYLANEKKLPVGLFSHSDQIKHWQTGRPGERSRYGWGGRIADLMAEHNTNPAMSMNISLNGTNQFQQGMTTTEYAIDPNERFGINAYDRNHHYHPQRTAAIRGMMERDYADVFEKTYVNTLKGGIEGGIKMEEALESSPSFDAVFSDTPLSQRFRTIARVIAARDRLGVSQQTFFVNFGGWDHHDDVLLSQEEKLPELSAALGEFQQALEQMGIFENVTTFTVSDFGRTLTSNGNGSDHAWGGNAMVMGGAVDGGKIFGNYPDLSMNGDLMLERGVLIPTTSAAEYMAELALWYGVSPGDLPEIFPDLTNFYNPGSESYPIGFMNPQS
ncbi:MAG: DUF1501 domain-containing protein [Cryomorphaceae bacterium]|nr:DUF1501 domain-containing protein [Flavobacteriales bacterium]